MSGDRIEWIDRWRGVLIASIVLFHVNGMAMLYASEGFCNGMLRGVNSAIQTYHVVSFFAIIGIIWKDSVPFGKFVLRKSKRLLLPYFFWGMVMGLVFTIAPMFISSGAPTYYSEISEGRGVVVSLLRGETNRVIGPLWFLPTLFVVEVIYWFSSRITRTWWTCVLACLFCVAVYEFELFKHTHVDFPWNIPAGPYYLFFVYVARLTIPLLDTAEKHGKRSFFFIVIAVICLCIAWIQPIWFAASRYLFIPYLKKMIHSSLAMIGVAAVARLLSQHWLMVVGKASLGILVMHKFIIVAFQAVPALPRFCFQSGVVMAILTIISLTCLAMIIPLVAMQFIRLKFTWMKWAIGEGK